MASSSILPAIIFRRRKEKYEIPEDTDPFANHLQVAYSTSAVLRKYSDKYFRGFDNSFPDYYRFIEWRREFAQYEKDGMLPNLSLVRIMHDHFGDYKSAIKGVNTPELADGGQRLRCWPARRGGGA